VITVLDPGPFASIQDLGRRGYCRWGISPGGAADRRSHSLANRLVGNAENAATIELTFGPVRLRIDEPSVIAVTGAAHVITITNVVGSPNGPIRLGPCDVTVHAPEYGVRSYVVIRGGIETPLILGSRATDTISGFGAALRAGDIIPVGRSAIVSDIIVDHAPTRGFPRPAVLTAEIGPQFDWFTPEALTLFMAQTYTVSTDSNRVGVRILGEPLTRRNHSELMSEPVIRGAIEVTTEGQPIIFMADHPTTCGYPVIAVLHSKSAGLAAQLRPGDEARIRFSYPRR
jgi:biotin-dependent carboxylase-like uncharacterized protein